VKPHSSLAAAVLGLTGCATSSAAPSIDVFAARAAQAGRQVEVRGFLRYGDDARGLWQSEAGYRDSTSSAASACLTLWNAGAFRKRLKPRDQSTVTIGGKIFTAAALQPDEIEFGRCSDTGLIIERIR